MTSTPFRDLINKNAKPKLHFRGNEFLSLSDTSTILVRTIFSRHLKYESVKPDHVVITFDRADSPSVGLEESISMSDLNAFHDELYQMLKSEGFIGFLAIEIFKAHIKNNSQETTRALADMTSENQASASKDESKDNASYKSVEPYYTFDKLILPKNTMTMLEEAIGVFHVYDQVFDQWGFSTIEPFPKCALNFYGPPGVGKTLSAHALASRLKKRIIVASYADIESKYHGDGPKNVQSIFDSAEKEKAVLFIDEADSLLSKRLTNVTQGSEQAINSMRSQLLICLEQFKGIVVFSTNLAENYDKAFETRIQHIKFELPDQPCRRKLWELHIPLQVPSRENIDFEFLSSINDVCGRDIKNACIQGAVSAALNHSVITTDLLKVRVDQIVAARVQDNVSKGQEADPELKDKILTALKKKRAHNDEKNASDEPI